MQNVNKTNNNKNINYLNHLHCSFNNQICLVKYVNRVFFVQLIFTGLNTMTHITQTHTHNRFTAMKKMHWVRKRNQPK